MELPSILFFSISYLVSTICCLIGGLVLFVSHDPDISDHPCSADVYRIPILLFISTNSNISDHPLPRSAAVVIVHFIALSTFTSSTYAFLFRPALENQQPHSSLHYGLFTVGKALISILCAQICLLVLPMVSPFIWIIPSLLLFGYLYHIFAYRRPIAPSIRMYLNHSYCWGLLSVVFAEVALPIFPCRVPEILSVLVYLLYLLVPISFSITYIAFKDRFGGWTASPFVMFVYRKRKVVEFAVGMVSTILFQYIFRAASMLTMVAFFFIATAWLGNLAMVQPSTDLGIFNFLLMNACINWAVNIFKLNGHTWLVFGACLVLFLLRWKLDSVSLRYNHIFASPHDRSHAPIPTTLPSIPTIPVTNISVLSANSNSCSVTLPNSTIASSLRLTLSNLQPPTFPATPPARIHSF